MIITTVTAHMGGEDYDETVHLDGAPIGRIRELGDGRWRATTTALGGESSLGEEPDRESALAAVVAAWERDVGGWLTLAQFADAAEVTAATLRGWRSKGLPRGNPIPEPERRNPETGLAEWSRVTVEQWIALRPGRGARTDITEGAS